MHEKGDSVLEELFAEDNKEEEIFAEDEKEEEIFAEDGKEEEMNLSHRFPNSQSSNQDYNGLNLDLNYNSLIKAE